MANGTFITFEGLDGSGKSTQLKLLAAWLTARGHTVEQTRQPGGTALGESIRELLLHSRAQSIDAHAELAMMFADRAQSIAEIIQPAIDGGKVILCDRYTDSSEAYQGAGRGLGTATVLDLHRAVCGNLQPALTVLLLPPLAASLARTRRRTQRAEGAADPDRFESQQSDFHERVHAAYKEIALRDAGRVVLVEDTTSIEAIHEKICGIVSERLGL